jgi:hypothetical protein
MSNTQSRFAGGAGGLLLQRVLPEKYTTGGPRDMIVAVAGLITFLSGLVGGLLIWTAYGVYSSLSMAIQNLSRPGAPTKITDKASGAYGICLRSKAGWERTSLS